MWASPLSRIRDGGVFLGQAVGAGGDACPIFI